MSEIDLSSPIDSAAGREQAWELKMKPATLLTVLLASALAFGQKFDVSDLSTSDSPISFTGITKVLKTGTACVVTAHNNSSQSLLAMRATAEGGYSLYMESAGHVPLRRFLQGVRDRSGAGF
jgi:hypothetical protein